MRSDRGPRLRAFAACAAVPLALGWGFARGQQPGGDEAQLKALRAEILKMIGEAPCVNVVHCRLLALGTRPCGGPDEYLAYSSHTADRATLENKALDYALLQEDIQHARSVAGICVVVPEPRIACIDRRCRVVTEP
jgi:hypothetical protein